MKRVGNNEGLNIDKEKAKKEMQEWDGLKEQRETLLDDTHTTCDYHNLIRSKHFLNIYHVPGTIID